MTIRVECYAGFRGEQEPLRFHLGGRRVEVLEIVDRWVEPQRRWFKCRTDDGHTYILSHDEESGAWEIAAFTRERPGQSAS